MLNNEGVRKFFEGFIGFAGKSVSPRLGWQVVGFSCNGFGGTPCAKKGKSQLALGVL